MISWEEFRTARSWPLDQPTSFEAVRILDHKPKQGILREARGVLSKAFPAFASMQVVES